MRVLWHSERAFDLFAKVHATPGYAAHLSFFFHFVLVHLVVIMRRHIAGGVAVYKC